jgi:hypothetical protein
MQTEKKGLTNREKRLLLLMLVVGFSAGMIVYVIIPFFNRWQDETALYDELSMRRHQIESLFASAPYVRSNHTAALEQYDEARERFLNESHISEIARMLTRIILDHNLSPIDLRMSPATLLTEWDAFTIMPVTMTISGGYEDLKRLLDTVFLTEYLRITRLSFGFVGAGATEDGERQERGIDRISVVFEVIMMRDVL